MSSDVVSLSQSVTPAGVVDNVLQTVISVVESLEPGPGSVLAVVLAVVFLVRAGWQLYKKRKSK
jgi:hypothetical protein